MKKSEVIDKYSLIFLLGSKLIDAFKSIGCLVAVGYTLIKVSENLAGKQTVANVAFNILADVKYVASWGVTAVTSAGWYASNKRNKNLIENKSKRIIELEKKQDTKRSSSKLECNGETNRYDKKL